MGFLLSLLALKMADFNESIVFESAVNFARSKLYRLILAIDAIINVKDALINNLSINFATVTELILLLCLLSRLEGHVFVLNIFHLVYDLYF